MRKALVVGIDYYENASSLFGCVNDAHSVKAALDRHGDGTVNFAVKLLAGNSSTQPVNRKDLRNAVKELFAGDSEIALLFFAGHGYIETTGGYLITSDTAEGETGIPLSEIVQFANESKARNKVILLDSCHSGIAGNTPGIASHADLSDGLTILTASTAEQYANEENGAGIFTTLLVDALQGAAANLVGSVSPGSVYSHIDQSLGPWQQRPVFKTNVTNFVSLRNVEPAVELTDLRRISEFYPSAGFDFPLDPSFEPTSKTAVKENTEIFSILQKFSHVNLVTPVGADHMYYAAMNSKSCKLTVLGEHYRRLISEEKI